MKRLLVSEAARVDLIRIGEHTAQRWGGPQKARYLAGIRECFSAIWRNPSIGRQRDDVRQGYRCIGRGNHVVFYREMAEAVEVVRVLHQNMDVHRHMDDDER